MGFKTHRGKAILAHILTLACFGAPFLFGPLVGGDVARFIGIGIGIAAAVIAYSSREGATPWAATHHEHILRTLMIAFVVLTVLSLPSYVVSREITAFWSVYNQIFFWSYIIVLAWVLIRSGVGLVLAGMRKPIWHPRGPLL